MSTIRKTSDNRKTCQEELQSKFRSQLLALAPETRRIHLIWEHGIPAAAQWPEVAGDKQKFTAEITDIRRNRSVRFAGEAAFAFSDEFVLSAPAAGEHELRPLAATLAGEKLP